jgi:ParB/RepB/Spo0J family partition protein
MSGAHPSQIDLGGISVRPERLRVLRPEIVCDLAQSMQTNGLLQPIIVRPRTGTGYWLVAGRHRFEAAKKLKWDNINALVFAGMNADQAELAEIEENLIRADLSPAERALHQARRKELYEKLHPETKHGAVGRGRKKSSQNENSFVNDAAAKTGKGRSTIARDVTRAKQVPVLKEIIGTSLDQGDEIDALAKFPEDEQRALAEQAKRGEQVSAKHKPQEAAAIERRFISDDLATLLATPLHRLSKDQRQPEPEHVNLNASDRRLPCAEGFLEGLRFSAAHINHTDLATLTELLRRSDNVQRDQYRRVLNRGMDALNAAGLGNKPQLQRNIRGWHEVEPGVFEKEIDGKPIRSAAFAPEFPADDIASVLAVHEAYVPEAMHQRHLDQWAQENGWTCKDDLWTKVIDGEPYSHDVSAPAADIPGMLANIEKRERIRRKIAATRARNAVRLAPRQPIGR